MSADDLQSRLEEKYFLATAIRKEMSKALVGQKKLVDGLLISLFCKNHILIEGAPGLAKTSAVKALSETVQARFKRIQFTPDLLPADLIGTEIYRPKTGEFSIKKGPLFNHIILADEINRAPSKVQSALLEAMQERQVTIGDTTFKLDDPFLVMATQNPIDQEGTYPLPEAQVDRFMLKVVITYPDKIEEKEIMKRVGFEEPARIHQVVSPDQLNDIVEIVKEIYVDEKLKDYMIDIIFATRNPADYGLDIADYIRYGASPRASIFLSQAARACAFLQGRAYVTPQDIKTIAMDVLRHRIILTYEAEAEDITTDQIIGRIFDSVKVP